MNAVEIFPQKFTHHVPSMADNETNANLFSLLNTMAVICHGESYKWWLDPKTKLPKARNKGEMISLMHSELSEMLEGVRKGKMDNHIPELTNEEVEAADLFIRLMDYCGGCNLNIAKAVIMKIAYNSVRADHTLEARSSEGGKAF